ncbi:MAG TPA: hypothetical protein VKO86_13585 [Gemmatimonadales bacterium]|nr:hypothetical protein [Gemmatimonadales bacterium]
MIKRIGRGLTLAGILAGATAAVPSAAHAQGKIELTPFVGSYYALTKMCTDCNKDGSNVTGHQLNAFAVGGRLSYWVSNTIGIEGSFAYAPSRAEERVGISGFGLAASGKGRIMQASGRFLYRPQRTNLHFIVGAGIVSRGDTAWQAFKENSPDGVGAKLTSVAGILGAGVRASVTPKFALNLAAELNLYSFDPRLAQVTSPAPNSANGSKLQADLLVTIGVPITLSH